MRGPALGSPMAMRDILRVATRAILPEISNPHGILIRRLARGSAAALALYVIGAGVSYCTQMSIARFVGAEGYGIYAYVITWMTLLAYFSALGFDVSLLRFVPAYRAQHAPDLMRGIIRYARCAVTAVGVSVALVGGAAIALASRHLSRELANTFLVGFAVYQDSLIRTREPSRAFRST